MSSPDEGSYIKYTLASLAELEPEVMPSKFDNRQCSPSIFQTRQTDAEGENGKKEKAAY
jgi:hypothetical protein